MSAYAYIPTPGSLDATKRGCTCPVAQNFHGVYPPLPDDSWWVDRGCPLHASWLSAQWLVAAPDAAPLAASAAEGAGGPPVLGVGQPVVDAEDQ